MVRLPRRLFGRADRRIDPQGREAQHDHAEEQGPEPEAHEGADEPGGEHEPGARARRREGREGDLREGRAVPVGQGGTLPRQVVRGEIGDARPGGGEDRGAQPGRGRHRDGAAEAPPDREEAAGPAGRRRRHEASPRRGREAGGQAVREARQARDPRVPHEGQPELRRERPVVGLLRDEPERQRRLAGETPARIATMAA